MKRFALVTIVFAAYLSLAIGAPAQSTATGIIPAPRSVEAGSGSFNLSAETRLVATDGVSRRSAKILSESLAKNYGLNLKIEKKSKNNSIVFVRTSTETPTDEGYVLDVTAERVTITGSAAGQFYAIQSLLQSIPVGRSERLEIAALKITDGPRFRYRGMHLDVARHFQPVEFVKRYVDLMSQYKFNTFHWHLTDDQGWRIEIRKYPKLTEIGSTRPETVKERNLTPYIGDGTPHGGFYSQKEIREVVDYAKERQITVIPEIELPGHASAVLAAYPQFGCKTDYKYKVQTTWGIFKEVYCPTDETFKFLEDVLDETIKLFPDSPYIHIGGDEVLKDHWKESAFVQQLKTKENLKDEHEVQSYFVRRIEKFINSRGKKIIGWDEILEGGLAPNATVMSWRGMKGGIEAAKSKHDVIMTPTDYVYFDYGQGDPAYEPLNIGSYVPLEKVYSFEAVPKELTADEAKYIIGGQANIWTEYMKTPQHIEYMAFPRMLALAEVLWTPVGQRDFVDFTRRMWISFQYLDRQNVSYRIPQPSGLQNMVVADERVTIDLQPQIRMSKIRITTDGTNPSDDSPLYNGPFDLELKEGEAKTVKVVLENELGRKSSVYAATIVRDRMRDPVALANPTEGVKYEVLIPADGVFGAGERKNGETKSLALNQFSGKGVDLKQPFAVTFDGYIKIGADGLYEFQIDSTWDTTVVLAGGMIINDSGTKDRKVRSAVIPLKAGLHRISIRYNHRGGDAAFRFRYGIKGQGLRQAGGGDFVY